MSRRTPDLKPVLLPQAEHWETVEAVAAYAESCMQVLGLEKWRFEWDKAIRRLGCCKPAWRVVSLSVHYVRKYLDLDQGQIRRTVLHELAHALSWEYNRTVGHGKTWHDFCRVLGIGDEKSRTRCEDFAPTERRTRQARFVLYHTETGEEFHRFCTYPKRTAARIKYTYIPGRKGETLGKLGIRPITGNAE